MLFFPSRFAIKTNAILIFLTMAGLIAALYSMPESPARSTSLILAWGAALWFTCFLFIGVLRPLHLIGRAASRAYEGDLAARAKVDTGPQELRELSDSFNVITTRLQDLEQARTDFFTTLSHEIKNPLAALKEGLNLLSLQGEKLSPEARTKGTTACLIASKRIESMINNLLNSANGRADFFALEFGVRDFKAAIQAAIDETRPMAEKRGMSFRFEADREIEFPFSWDGIIHVCENLFQNAIKYGQEGSVIKVQCAASEREVTVKVENTGKGIAEVELCKIFDKFYRASNSTREKGLGIGLHVVKRIIESHQGTIQARSDAGHTSFEIRIPTEIAAK